MDPIEVRVSKAILALDSPTQLIKDREHYGQGDFDRPYAPPGLEEYTDLRDISGAPLVQVAINTVARRLKVNGIHTDPKKNADEVLQRSFARNYWTSRQSIVFKDMLTHGVGLVSVWPQDGRAVVNVEDPMRVYLGWSKESLFELDYAVKVLTVVEPMPEVGELGLLKAYYYDAERVYVFQAVPDTGNHWKFVEDYPNPLGMVPFVPFVNDWSSSGKQRVYVDALITIVKAIDTIRYDLLLAAQFAAYRQRIATGVDPVIRDADGNPIFKVRRDGAGNEILDEEGMAILELDENGMPIPLLHAPGRAGVDRLLVFPGEATKVYDLSESDLKNYIAAAQYLESSFSAASHVPSQYLGIGDWSNVSGDTMEANEAGLRSFVMDLQTVLAEALRRMVWMIDLSEGRDPDRETPIEVSWRNMEPKSLTQVASASSQMVPQGAPIRMFLEMLANSPAEVDRWMTSAQDMLTRAMGGDMAAGFGPKAIEEDDEE